MKCKQPCTGFELLSLILFSAGINIRLSMPQRSYILSISLTYQQNILSATPGLLLLSLFSSYSMNWSWVMITDQVRRHKAKFLMRYLNGHSRTVIAINASDISVKYLVSFSKKIVAFTVFFIFYELQSDSLQWQEELELSKTSQSFSKVYTYFFWVPCYFKTPGWFLLPIVLFAFM